MRTFEQITRDIALSERRIREEQQRLDRKRRELSELAQVVMKVAA